MKTSKYTAFASLILTLLAGAFVGCEPDNAPPPDTRSDFAKGLAFDETRVSGLVSKAGSVDAYLDVKMRRHGLVYFPYVGGMFKEAFEKYFDAHPEVEPVSVAGDSDAMYDSFAGREYLGKLSERADPKRNNTVSTHAGYFVLTRKKPAEAK